MTRVSILNATEGRPVVITSSLIYRCKGCGWFRFVVDDLKERKRPYFHRAWGMVTVLEAAQKDVEYHDCAKTQQAKDRVYEYVRSLD